MERLIHLLIFPLVIAKANAVEINLPASTEMLQSIDSVINEAVNKSKIPGGVIWLEKEGNKHHKAYGDQSLLPVKKVMKNASIFDAASLTKVMATAPSIMILIEQDRIALDDPVRKHLPQWHTYTFFGQCLSLPEQMGFSRQSLIPLSPDFSRKSVRIT